VFRLGDELITDELQALVELVKNSYDASATSTNVEVDTKDPASVSAVTDEDAEPVGWVEVQDNGDGMTREQLDKGWLLISTSTKRTMKEAGKTNRLGRTPLGDKGLGRLGVFRLGFQVEIRTRPRSRPEEHILRFTRLDFEHEQALSDVKPHYEMRPIEKKKGAGGGWAVDTPFADDISCSSVSGRQGTVIRVSGLTNRDVWKDRVRVQQEMLTLISPFESLGDFALSVYLDDPKRKDPLALGELSDLRRDLADVRWSFGFDRKELTASGRIKLDAFAPAVANKDLRSFWDANVVPDQGAELRRRLANGTLEAYRPHAADAPWWLSVDLSVKKEDVATEGAQRRKKGSESAWADPGPFSGEVDSFSLSSNADFGADEGIFSSRERYKQWVRDFRGVKVFRDGFGIRVGDDFLGLGRAFTGGRSFYTLRPGNVVGYISLSARDNSQLKETTDREGFVASPPYRIFSSLLATLVDRINVVQTEIGREVSRWMEEVGPPTVESPAEKAEELAEEAGAREERTREAVASMGSLRDTLRELSDGPALLTPDQAKEAAEATKALEGLQALVRESEVLSRDLRELAKGSVEVERERAQLRDQLRAAYQTVGLGIVAETVAHEMTNITGRLEAEAEALAPKFKGSEQRAARALAGEVKSTVREIRRQIRHLDPQLRYQRTSRHVLDVRTVVEEVADYHHERLSSVGIAITMKGHGFDARINRGRLQQALDNLVINSEFWLVHAQTPKAEIIVTVKSPTITVADNGPGVDPGLETAIFEPFVSGRTGEEGRGLGLFIVRQVLRDDEATIYLGDRAKDGRRRSFVLDFSGALPDETDA
jgi:signal transduction histidine kinase